MDTYGDVESLPRSFVPNLYVRDYLLTMGASILLSCANAIVDVVLNESENMSFHPPSFGYRIHRSGKIAIWPYIMRDLPISPVEALRLELRSSVGHGAPTDSQSAAGTKLPKNVEYFPACIADDEENVGGSTVRLEQEQGPRTGSDLNALKEKLSKVQRREQELLSAGGDPAFVLQRANGAAVSPPHATSSSAWPDDFGSKNRQPAPGRRRRPSSSGPGRRPRAVSLVDEHCSLLRRGNSDRIECPSGCGEEVRMADLGHHQASLCELR